MSSYYNTSVSSGCSQKKSSGSAAATKNCWAVTWSYSHCIFCPWISYGKKGCSHCHCPQPQLGSTYSKRQTGSWLGKRDIRPGRGSQPHCPQCRTQWFLGVLGLHSKGLWEHWYLRLQPALEVPGPELTPRVAGRVLEHWLVLPPELSH